MVDLSFHVLGDDFLITAHSERGQRWLVECTSTISIESDGEATAAKCWIETEAEFERLYAKAAALGSGLTVARNPAGIAPDGAGEARQ